MKVVRNQAPASKFRTPGPNKGAHSDKKAPKSGPFPVLGGAGGPLLLVDTVSETTNSKSYSTLKTVVRRHIDQVMRTRNFRA